jgi:tetratricopeptide (TPR) repeat protein
VLREGLELALRSGIVANAAWIAGSLGDSLLLLGQLEDAETYERQAVDLARRVGDEPLVGMRLISLALVLVQRGRLEEAVAVREEALPILRANPEPQADIFVPLFDGYLAIGRRDLRAAVDGFAGTIELLRGFAVESLPDAFASCVRVLVRLGERERAGAFRDLDTLDYTVEVMPAALNVRGLLAPDPAEAERLLAEAVAAAERFEMRTSQARAMVDLARAIAANGRDPRPTLEEARAILEACDARLFLVEIEDALAELA